MHVPSFIDLNNVKARFIGRNRHVQTTGAKEPFVTCTWGVRRLLSDNAEMHLQSGGNVILSDDLVEVVDGVARVAVALGGDGFTHVIASIDGAPTLRPGKDYTVARDGDDWVLTLGKEVHDVTEMIVTQATLPAPTKTIGHTFRLKCGANLRFVDPAAIHIHKVVEAKSDKAVAGKVPYVVDVAGNNRRANYTLDAHSDGEIDLERLHGPLRASGIPEELQGN